MRRLWAFLPALLALNASFLSVPASPEPLAPRLLPEVSVSSSAPLKALASPSEDPYFCSVDEIETGVLSEISALLGKKSSQSIEMLPVTNYAEYEAHLKAKDYDLLSMLLIFFLATISPDTTSATLISTSPIPKRFFEVDRLRFRQLLA